MRAYRPEDLTVVIPTRDRWDVLRRTLTALQAQTAPGARVLVVVDGEDQQVPGDLLGAEHLQVSRRGPGGARNAGTAATRSELVLFLGDDMVPTPGLVEAHLRAHTAHPQVTTGVLGLVAWHPEVADDRLARWLDWSSSQFDFGSIRDGRPGFGHFVSCNVSLHRAALDSVGGFDEEFTYYYEDLDLGRRLHDGGVRFVHAPEALAHHLHRYSWSALQRRFTGIARGERMMAAKHAWFEPFFKVRMEQSLAAPPELPAWGRLEARLPAGRLRDEARRRADLAYRQQLAPAFLAAWEGERELEELREYLGPAYDAGRLATAAADVDREERAAGDEATFYRTSEAYLYDLTVFAMSGTKAPYLQALRRLVAPPARLLDVGCGTGSDGLRLLEQGYAVDLVDYANPSTRFLRWRLQRRGLTAAVHDVERGLPEGPFDLAYSFDVVEHVPDPVVFLRGLEERSRFVLVNLLEPSADDPHVHRPLDVPALLARARDRGLLLHRVHHGRSHLVAYAGDLAGARVPAWRSVVEHRAGPVVGPRLPAARNLPGVPAVARVSRPLRRAVVRAASARPGGTLGSRRPPPAHREQEVE